MKAEKFGTSTATSCSISCGHRRADVPAEFPDVDGQTEGLKKVRAMKKDRARMLTILRDANCIRNCAGAGGKKKRGK